MSGHKGEGEREDMIGCLIMISIIIKISKRKRQWEDKVIYLILI